MTFTPPPITLKGTAGKIRTVMNQLFNIPLRQMVIYSNMNNLKVSLYPNVVVEDDRLPELIEALNAVGVAVTHIDKRMVKDLKVTQLWLRTEGSHRKEG